MKHNKISVVLVRTIYPSNIGSISRAMSNMGIDRLVLIDRQCEINKKARQSAANGSAPMQNRVEYKTWQEFYQTEGEGLRIALTAREGRERQITELNQYLNQIKGSEQFDEQANRHVYLIFGPEDCGLSAEDMKFVHQACYIPTYGSNLSLNLAHAVLVTLYSLRQAWGGTEREIKNALIESGEPLVFPEETLKKWLESLGFDISSKRVNAFTVMRRLLLQNVPGLKELNLLETVLQQNIRKLNEGKIVSSSFRDQSLGKEI